MKEKALPVEGAKAVVDALSDANEMIIKNGEKRRKEEENEELREIFKG